MLRSFSNREKTLLLVLALILVIMAYYLLIQVPVTNNIAAAQADLVEAQADLTLAQAKAMQMQQMQTELEEMTAQNGGSLAEIPEYDNQKQVMNLLNTTLASATNYNVTFSPVDLTDTIVRRAITMTFTAADYNAAKSMVLALLGGPYRCQISELSLTAGEGISVGLTITYFEVQPETAVADTTTDAAVPETDAAA